jgi:formylmethanofuran dehydrogenase subunit C
MGVGLTLKKQLETLLDFEPLSAVASADANAVAKIKLRYGRTAIPARELFEIVASEEEGLVLRGDLRLGINVGAGLFGGRMSVESSVGAGAGARMTGGELRILGDAGKNACAGMQDGFVRICGTVETGFAREVRRGTIVVERKADGEACAGLLGGTVLLLGGACDANRLANGMSRGTVFLPEGAAVPDGFSRTSDVDLTFLRLLFRMLNERGVFVPAGWTGGVFTRYLGDAAGLGKGEIFVPAGERV